VLINNGELPINGPFSLSGQVLGSPHEGQTLALFVRIDPLTCDTSGRRGAAGRFLIEDVAFDELDGTWSHFDNLGDHSAGVTYGRIFEFAAASPAVIEGIKRRHKEWNDGGLDRKMLNGVAFLAKFVVPPGKASNSRPCFG
jgi:hypothetical protein